MTALDRALSWFLEPKSTTRDDSAAPEAGSGSGDEHAGARSVAPAERALSAWRGRRRVARGAPARGGVADVTGADIASAAVLGRPGQAEPVAAAAAIALARAAPARAATVVVVGAAHPDAVGSRTTIEDPATSPGGGTRAARRLAARLAAHGLPARPRGRLVWVAVPLEGRQAAARRASLVGAPAVLAVTAPRALDFEGLLAEQDLLLFVMADPAGPLARLAALGPGGVRVAVTRPLSRGPWRSLAIAGVCAPRGMRRLLAAAAGEPPIGLEVA